MYLLFKMTAVVSIFMILLPVTTQAQETAIPDLEEVFYRGTIVEVQDSVSVTNLKQQNLSVELTNGPLKGDVVASENVLPSEGDTWRQFEQGDHVVILESQSGDATIYYVTDFYRLPAMVGAILLFFLLALLIARKKGAYAIAGLILSIAVIGGFIVPQIAAGRSPLLIGGVGAVIISIVSLYIAHGFSKRTSLALAGMLVTVLAAAAFSWVIVDFAQLFGVGSEEANSLQFGLGPAIDLRGILLAGVLIGALGVLDDVTTALVATVAEIHDANPSLSRQELFKKGWNVGTEHISSLINTLVLAYAGAALPLLLLFTLDYQPFWVTINGQFLGEEILRTVVGSTALLLAVPLTTYIASRYFGKKE